MSDHPPTRSPWPTPSGGAQERKLGGVLALAWTRRSLPVVIWSSPTLRQVPSPSYSYRAPSDKPLMSCRDVPSGDLLLEDWLPRSPSLFHPPASDRETLLPPCPPRAPSLLTLARISTLWAPGEHIGRRNEWRAATATIWALRARFSWRSRPSCCVTRCTRYLRTCTSFTICKARKSCALCSVRRLCVLIALLGLLAFSATSPPF